MKSASLTTSFALHPGVIRLHALSGEKRTRIQLSGVHGSGIALIAASVFELPGKQQHVVVVPDKEQAAYLYNDLERLLADSDTDFNQKRVLFYPTSYKRPYEPENTDASYQLSRTEVLKRFMNDDRKTIVVTYPEALSEKVITKRYLSKNLMKLKVGESVSLDFVVEILSEFDFEPVDFVAEPGQFAIRGGIVDVFSFSNDHPYRIEFFGDEIESIRSFDPATQRSIQIMQRISLLPNVQNRLIKEDRVNFLDYIPAHTLIWLDNIELTQKLMEEEFAKAVMSFNRMEDKSNRPDPAHLFADGSEFNDQILNFKTVQYNAHQSESNTEIIRFNQKPKPAFNKNFNLLIENIRQHHDMGFRCLIFSENPKQTERLYSIFEDLQADYPEGERVRFVAVNHSLSQGFVDEDQKWLCYTDHQLFGRYHRFKLREGFGRKEALSLKELYDLTPGDFVTHIDHGVGRFDGLQIIDNNGKKQEAIRLMYKNNDLLYVSIHSLHRISKYIGKDGVPPALNKLGSANWTNLKNKTKKKVKDIARDLIKLYARRKAAVGFPYMPDTYLQNELEASFIYEDTPDQLKATIDFKKDMEASYPMDRLVCGDVGFGKTEIAIRAAFKAVTDSKQVAVLVPTTILALQHFKTFSDRLKDFPVNIDYINRFKSAKEQKETLLRLESGELDILIGTHRLLSQDILFKDLGLFIVDEEQKFGVAAKEKLRQKRAHVDTLTLTATPIPRTLQFSLLGARDLSIINTPPPNRYPVHTEIRSFGEEIITDAINYEVSRGGQVFFVHNRVNNILDVYEMLHKFIPGVRIAVAHGQMEGSKLERIMLDFIDGEYDVLLSTTIIESGLDISNANTIIINDAQNYGLSDLHQLRGRVGRSNKKAFCYLLAPPLGSLTQEARKRLKALEEHAELGSGFNIAMRDLDIRGAGNLLGGEQSGFISDIGYEMYQKILDEAIQELKEDEFGELYKQETKDSTFVKDCQIETDLEILIPDTYISNITERMSLYKELDGLETEAELTQFADALADRFGTMPQQVLDLIDSIRLRWLARRIGFTKLYLKNNRMSGYFTGTQNSPYFQSEAFGRVLSFLQSNPKICVMKQVKESLTLRFEHVKSIKKAIDLLRAMTDTPPNTQP
ncbi:MAG: transcription-repair coupling factor [Bacteroidetes bacterium]|nr:transcription-repair coupling factor [Bacteroidota bacterium]